MIAADPVTPRLPVLSVLPHELVHVDRVPTASGQYRGRQVVGSLQPVLKLPQPLADASLPEMLVVLDADEHSFGFSPRGEHNPVATVGHPVYELGNVTFHASNANLDLGHGTPSLQCFVES